MKYILFTTLIASSSAISLSAFDDGISVDDSGIEAADSNGRADGAADGSTRRFTNMGRKEKTLFPNTKEQEVVNPWEQEDNQKMPNPKF